MGESRMMGSGQVKQGRGKSFPTYVRFSEQATDALHREALNSCVTVAELLRSIVNEHMKRISRARTDGRIRSGRGDVGIKNKRA